MLNDTTFGSLIEQRINEEIQSLSNHEHVSSIQRVNVSTYKLVYAPASTNSVYRDKSYSLEISLPQSYPENPPALRFIDSVYHLNINYENGEVRMATLEEDWSPFLSLTSVIESLDKILEEPEKDFPADSSLLELYENNRIQYLSKVLESLNAEDVSLEASLNAEEASLNAEVDVVLCSSQQQNQRESRSPIKTLSQKQQSESECIKKAIHKAHTTHEIKISSKKSLLAQNQSEVLTKMNETVNAFIADLSEIESQIQSTNNMKIKTLLQNRYSTQLQMLEELLLISDAAKKKVVKKLKEEMQSL